MVIVFTKPAHKALKDVCDYYKNSGSELYVVKL